MKHILMILVALISFADAFADNFKVHEIIGPNVTFKGKCLKRGDIIKDSDPIALNDKNVLTLFNLNKSLKTYTASGAIYKRRKCKTLGEYFSSNVGTLTRDDKGNRSLKGQMDSIFIWVDNVTVQTMFPKNNNRIFAIEIIDGVQLSHTIQLPTFDGGRYFSIPKELIYGNKEPYPLVFNLLVGIKDPETDEVAYETVVYYSILMPIISRL